MYTDNFSKDNLKITTTGVNHPDVNTGNYRPFTSATDYWRSPGFIEGDRALAVNERIDIYLINQTDGTIAEDFLWWPFDEATAAMGQWQQTIVQSLYANGRSIRPGEVVDSVIYLQAIAYNIQQGSYIYALRNSYWYKDTISRAFSTHPHKNNWDKCFDLAAVDLPSDAKIEIQITDRSTGFCYDTQVFTPDKSRLKAGEWPIDLCTQLNKSRMVRAGKYDATNHIAPAATGSSVWIPKNSDLLLVVASTGNVLSGFKLSYDLTLPSESALPDMTGFDQDELGIPPQSWLSPGYLLGDRDLVVGEKLYTWLIRCSDGQPLEEVTFTADATSKTQWPQQFAKQINSSAKHVRAGGWNDKGEFTDLAGNSTSSSFTALDLIGKSLLNRLWHYSRDNRTFSTAPFNTNWVQALLFAALPLEAESTLCVQVRDITSQYLYETHLFTPKAAGLTAAQWAKDLCSQINRDSKMLLAGVRDSTTWRISPADKDNALWIPQCSDLAVTVEPVAWWTEQTINAARDLAADESIYTYVQDEYSSAQLIKPHCFTPANADERKRENWPGAWAKSLKASSLAPYVRLGSSTRGSTDPGKGATQAALWQAGAALRVFTTEPSDGNWLTFSIPLTQIYKNGLSSIEIRLVHELTQRVIYRLRPRTRSGDVPGDATSWWKKTAQAALTQFKQDGKPYIQILADPVGSVRVPRFSGLSIVLEPATPISNEEVNSWKIIETLRNYNKEEIDRKDTNISAQVKRQEENVRKVLDELEQKKLYSYLGLESSNFKSSGILYKYIPYLEIANKIEQALEPKAQSPQGLDNRVNAPKILTMPLSNVEATEQSADAKPRGLPSTDTGELFRTVTTLLKNRFNNADSTATLTEKVNIMRDLMHILSATKKQSSPISSLDMYRFIMRSDYDEAISLFESLKKSSKKIDLAFFLKLVTSESTLYITDSSAPSTRSYEILYSDDYPATFSIRLTPFFRMIGARLIASPAGLSEYESFNIHFSRSTAPDAIPLAYTGFTHAGRIWEKSGTLPYKAPLADELPVPESSLCEDYGNTYRSEVFDVSGQTITGVDPRTGLFNAHYSIGTLTDLEGKGPVIDLTLHYSPLRANEAGLGDGWAFNFSWYDSRLLLLTLSTGQTIQFTDAEITDLKADKTVNRPICQITAKTTTVNKQLVVQSLDVLFLSGRKEVLAVGDGDATEHNAEFVQSMIERLLEAQKQIPLFIKSKKPVLDLAWYDKLAGAFFAIFTQVELPSFTVAMTEHLEQLKQWKEYWGSRLSELQRQVTRELEYWQTPDQQLIPSRIISPMGGELTFNWQRKQGQYLLNKVSAGDKTLLTATYAEQTVAGASAITSTVTFTLWPDTSESVAVQLDLKDYLLDAVSRYSPQDQTVVERVQYGYDLDPTLDRVLTSITESDGSLEKVFYEAEGMQFPEGGDWKPALPRVRTHVISPGVDQPSLRTDWAYSTENFLGYTSLRGYNRFEDTAAKQGVAYVYSSTATLHQGLSTKRSWNGLHLQTEERQTSPDGASKITQWTFGSATQHDLSFGSPTSIRTIYQDA